jgi:hypothetical protein
MAARCGKLSQRQKRCRSRPSCGFDRAPAASALPVTMRPRARRGIDLAGHDTVGLR